MAEFIELPVPCVWDCRENQIDMVLQGSHLFRLTKLVPFPLWIRLFYQQILCSNMSPIICR